MTQYSPLLIAIDGPAASGKGTVGRQLAVAMGYVYLDTGKLYRAVGYGVMQRELPLDTIQETPHIAADIAQKIDVAALHTGMLETEEVGRAASVVSGIPEVRQALLEFQRNVAKSPQGAVLDGRDIGTVVCPEADVKFFITATAEVRAERRFKQLRQHNKSVIYEHILRDIQARDARDSSRAIAPLVRAEGAHFVDTTAMELEAVFTHVLAITQDAAVKRDV